MYTMSFPLAPSKSHTMSEEPKGQRLDFTHYVTGRNLLSSNNDRQLNNKTGRLQEMKQCISLTSRVDNAMLQRSCVGSYL